MRLARPARERPATDDSGSADAALALLVAAALLVVYALTLLPGPGYSGDTIKFQFVGRVLGIPHATGYPGYVLANHLFVRLLPFGSLAWRANLLSALFAAAAGAVLLLTLRLLGARRAVAASLALAFGLTYTMWSQAVVAEVYSLHLLLMAATIHLLLRWRRRGGRRTFLAACAVYALSFGNHLTALMLLPAVVYLVWVTERGIFRDGRRIAAVAGLVLLAACQYGYLVWRSRSAATPYLEAETSTVGELLRFVTGAQFRPLMFAFSAGELLRDRLPLFGELLGRETWFLLPLALLGLARGRDGKVTIFLGLYFLCNLAWGLTYRIPDVFVTFLPNYYVVALLAGVGATAAVSRLSRVAPRWTGPVGRLGGAALAVAAPAFFLALNHADADRSGDVLAARWTEQVLAAADRDALILSPGYDHSECFWYYLLGEGRQGRGLYLMHHFDAGAVARYLAGGEPIYLPEQRLRVPPGLTVYATAPAQLPALRAAGLRAEAAAAGLHRVRAAP